MFGNSKREQQLVPPPAPSYPRPVPQTAVGGTACIDAYQEIARALNYNPAQLIKERLLRFLDENTIPIYEYKAVDMYLGAIAEREGKVWIWRPLRKQDVPSWQWRGRVPSFDPNNTYRGHGSYIDEWEYRPYPHAVPIHILRHAKKIQDEFGEQVKFFVSDYADPRPDPFIMVTALDVDKIIFGMWDEPGFV